MLLERKIKGLELKSKNLPSNFINWLAIGINMDSDTMNFEDFIKNKLTLSSSDIEVLFYYYFSTKNDNEKKLLKLAFEFIGTRNSMAHYVDYLLTNYTINTKQEFIKSLYLCTDLHVMESGYIARKEWIKIIKNKDGNIEAPNELFQIFSDELLKDIKKHIYFDQTTISIQNDNIDDLLMLKTDSREKVEQIYSTYKERFVNKILTSESQNEKRLIVLLASNNIFNNNELETFYPDLYGYLFYKSNSFTNIPSLDEYFGEYKKSKIANRE